MNGDLHLSQEQISSIDKIVDYAIAHGVSTGAITLAVNQAFYESSLGSIRNNPGNSDVTGLFQYDAATWKDLGHESLNRHSDEGQIAAMFKDIDRYFARYDNLIKSGNAPNDGFHNLSFEEYLEVKHHLGNNSTDWGNSVVKEYNDRTSKVGFH